VTSQEYQLVIDPSKLISAAMNEKKKKRKKSQLIGLVGLLITDVALLLIAIFGLILMIKR